MRQPGATTSGSIDSAWATSASVSVYGSTRETSPSQATRKLAQTLAAAFGVLTAIVVVRLPAIEASVDAATLTILSKYGATNDARRRRDYARRPRRNT